MSKTKLISKPKEESLTFLLNKEILCHKKDSKPYGLRGEKVKIINNKDYLPVIIVEGCNGNKFPVNENDLCQ